MIKFFRKIRYNLMGQNKKSKYFKYAIGEIILVVIGILMALQINNWNENRKKQALKKSYVTNLINDLNKDTIQLNARLKTNKEKLLQIDSIANLIEASSSVKSLYSHLMSNPTQFGLRVTNTYNANTFNILISSGNIDLFSNNFTNILMELNRLQLAEIIVSEGNSNHFFSGLVHFRNQFVDARGLNNQVLSEAITSNYDSKKYVSLYYNLLITQRHTVSRYIELTSKVKLQTEVLLNELLSSDNL